MKSSTRSATICVVASALLLTTNPAHAEGVWSVVPSPTGPGGNALFDADASDAGHVWAVGRQVLSRGAEFQSQILRHDGTAWRAAPLSGFPDEDALFAVDAVSGTEAWAAGASYPPGILRSDTLVARWNGTTWAPEPTPNGNPTSVNHLSGVAAAGGTVWAVGSYLEPGSSYNRRALILQRTGGSWRSVAAPRVLTTDFLEAVDATGPANAWAVGWGSSDLSAAGVPIALRWDGTRWRSVSVPHTASTALYAVEALSATNVWAAGQTYTAESGVQPYVARFDGISWRRVATPTIPGGGQLTDIVGLSASNMIAVGTGGNGGTSIVLHWNGASWTREAAPDTLKLAGAAAVGPNTFWAVGNGFDLNAYQDRNFTMVRS